MNPVKPSLIILAAGIGSRYGSLKQLDKLGPEGETIIDYSVYDAMRAGFGKVVFVIRKSIEREFVENQINKLVKYVDVNYVLQELEFIPNSVAFHPERTKPWGTGHAVLMARDVVNEPFAVINADDFYGAEAFKVLHSHLVAAKEGEYAMVGYHLKNTLSEHGSVSRGICETNDKSLLTKVTERTSITPRLNKIFYTTDDGNEEELDSESIVSMNFWGFTPDFFHHLEAGFNEFIHNNSLNLKAEYFIPTVVNDLINSGKASVRVLKSRAEWFGVTYIEDREIAIRRLKELTNQNKYPRGLWRKH